MTPTVTKYSVPGSDLKDHYVRDIPGYKTDWKILTQKKVRYSSKEPSVRVSFLKEKERNKIRIYISSQIIDNIFGNEDNKRIQIAFMKNDWKQMLIAKNNSDKPEESYSLSRQKKSNSYQITLPWMHEYFPDESERGCKKVSFKIYKDGVLLSIAT